MNAFLSADELARLTGKRRHKAQVRALQALGMRFILAATGEPLVRPSDLDEHGKPAQRGHRWNMIGSVRQMRP